ncbi:MAG: T9SS type A sorting domain-containing protein [Saprospiraceae bacterium]|nr:T9SS type A sorting domain-containing protein [Saprospiraceae bacterium]MCF8252226.1 T9SS type A sorting domain-containing protein [Saprospiraceae bacterium]MCF8282024.1 T9SS type A sorting domain-containing protein [Bacteroidales bacterium]MCF8311682.1 T9SS type A sorting domain-containing protein [Saprospiraceae bacterium]MCF8442601.1 T9SS type A sorting domain-containing protein [Saprospiraceae bacterium]
MSPTVTFSTTTFKVDDIEPIGTYGQPTLLSSLTGGSGPLLAPNQSDGNPQRIAVNGTLVIDQNYWFTSNYPNSDGRASDLIMLPGSKIKVKEGYTLHTSWENIHECDYGWEGIELLPSTLSVPNGGKLDFGKRTMLRGATVGVKMENRTSFNFVDSEIRYCVKGLAATGPDFKEISFTGLNSPWGNSISFFEYCDEGIHLENTSDLNLTMATGLPYLIINNMEKYGIYLEGTNLVAMGLAIQDCGNGIRVNESNSSVILDNMICTGNGGKGIGIFTKGTNNLRVTNSVFINWNTGINRLTNMANQYTKVENSSMYQCVHNIWGSVLPSKADILFNNLNAVSHNVWLAGIGSGNHNWNIGGNTALRSGATPPSNMPSVSYINRNIFLGDVRYANIFNNETDFTSPSYNIYITGGLNNTVISNIMEAPFSTKNNLAISGTDATIYCNTMKGASTAMSVMNTCAGSIIRINDFSGAYGTYNLMYGSDLNSNASTQPQELAGNIFDESLALTPKAKHFAPDYIAVQSQYRIGRYRYSSGSYPENYQGESHYPYFLPTSFTHPWFIKKSAGVDQYECNEYLTKQEVLENAAQTDINLLNIRIDTVFGDEVAFDTKLKLYRHLEDLSALTTLTGDFYTWYHDSLSSTDFAKFIEFENRYRDAATFTDVAVGQSDLLNLEIDSLSQILDSLGNELDSVVWWVKDTSTNMLIIDSALVADFVAVKLLMDQKLDTFSILVMDKQAIIDTMLDDMLSVNNSIGTQTTTSGENLKAINALLLYRLDPEFGGFSEEDSTDLAEIALQCVGEGGEGVYIARALLAEHSLEYVEYEDECVEERSSLSHGGMTSLPSSLRIAPIPADESARVELPKEHGLTDLALLDAYGRVVRVYGLSPTQTQLKLDTSQLAEGVYFLYPSNKKEGPVRFVVLH